MWLDEHAAALALGRKLREAAELLEKARIGEPKNLKIARRLLAIYRELDEHEKARALAIDMRGGALASPAEITALAGTLRDMGNLEEGLALAKDGVSRFADNIGLWGLACDFLRRLDRPQEERAMTLEILRRFPPEKSVKSCGLNLVRIHERIHGQLPAIESPDIQAIIARIRQWAKTRPIIPISGGSRPRLPKSSTARATPWRPWTPLKGAFRTIRPFTKGGPISFPR